MDSSATEVVEEVVHVTSGQEHDPTCPPREVQIEVEEYSEWR
jgi:hypothetical protein